MTKQKHFSVSILNKSNHLYSVPIFLCNPASSLMAVKFQTVLFFLNLVVVVFFISAASPSQASPQNIEVFYPPPQPPPPPNISPNNPPPSPPGSVPDSEPSSSNDDDTNRTIAKAVGATAASTIVIAGLFFFFIRKYVNERRKRDRVGIHSTSDQPIIPPPADEFARVVNNGNIKGFIVDENGLDVLYWKQLQLQDVGENNKRRPKDEEEGGGTGIAIGMVRKVSRNKKAEPVHEIPLLRGKSSTSHVPPPVDDDSPQSFSPLSDHGINALRSVEKKKHHHLLHYQQLCLHLHLHHLSRFLHHHQHLRRRPVVQLRL